MGSQKDVRALNQIPLDRERNRKDRTMDAQRYRNPGDESTRELRTIGLKDVVEAARKLADAHPGRLARGVLATRTVELIDGELVDTPHAVCVVGHIYLRFGVPLPDLLDMENAVGAERFIGDDWSEQTAGPVDFGKYGLQFTLAAVAFLLQLQREQDTGETWGTAFQRTLGRAHVVFGTELTDDTGLYTHGEHISWPAGGTPIKIRIPYGVA